MAYSTRLLDRISPAFVWTATAVGLLVMLTFFVAVGYDFYRATARNAEQQAANIAQLVEQGVAREVELHDLSLQAVLDGLGDEEVMRQSPHVRHIALFDRSATAQGLGALVVINQDGNIVQDSLSAEPRKGNFADREYFKAHMPTNIGLYISKPFKARLQNDVWSISLSRRINGPGGAFGGIVSGTVKLSYFRERFQSVRLGDNGTITLLRDDGVMLVQNNGDESKIGADWRAAPIFARLRAEPVGTFWTSNSRDGIPRLFAYQRIGDLPLVVSVGMAQAEILAPWWDKAYLLAATYAVMAASILLLVFLFVRELRRRAVAEHAQASLARRDALTGLANRLGLNEALEAEWSRARRSKQPLSLLLLDLDSFKQYNDRYGHVEGDRVLAMIGSIVKQGLRRPADLAARYGGEEIAVLLPDTPADGALVVAQAIRETVEQLGIPHASSAHGVVTVSIGIATVLPRSGTPAALLELADSALYVAKNSGRNRVEASFSGLQDRAVA